MHLKIGILPTIFGKRKKRFCQISVKTSQKREFIMRKILSILTAICVATVLFAISGCKKSVEPPDTYQSYLSATVDGKAFKSNIGAFAVKATILGVTYLEPAGVGLFNSDTLSLGLMIQNGSIGTYSLDGSRINTFGALSFSISNKSYSSEDGKGSGTLKVTNYTNERVAGTFNFVAYTSDGQESINVTNGEFDLLILGS